MGEALLEKVLVRSRFLEILPLETGNYLCLQTLVQSRLVVEPAVVRVLEAFAEPRRVDDWITSEGPAHGGDPVRLLHVVSGLLQHRMLYAGTPAEERAAYLAVLSQWYGRDPEAARRAAHRWSSQQVPRFAAPAARGLDDFAPAGRRLDVVMVGLCDVQIEMDVLRAAARDVGIDLHPVATFETTLDVLDEGPHDAVIVGALGARHGHWHRADGGGDFALDRYTRAMRDLLLRIRARSGVPILVHTLAVPTCSPLGLADRGPDSPIERCRRINRALVDIASEYPDVYVVDVDAALSYEGKRRLLDDRVMTLSHLGALGWWTMLPKLEVASVHGIRPPVERLSELGVSDPFEFDRVVATAQAATLAAIFGVGRRDTVAVMVDGTLWPGDLTTTGSPFPPHVDFGTWSFHGFFMGVGEALRGLIGRGIRLAGLTRGAEHVVRASWKYPGRAPVDRLLLPDDFAALRFGVTDVVDAVRQVAAELETEPARMVLLAADPPDREAARQQWPALMVLGDNPFAVRGALLTHPALQVVTPVQEGVEHPAIMVALARRERARKQTADPEAFAASLAIRCRLARGVATADLDRVHELVSRTRQFNTTGRAFSRDELAAFHTGPSNSLLTMRVSDQFADYGLVGVVAAIDGTIEVLLLSCRVVGLGVDGVLLRAAIRDLLSVRASVRGRLLRLSENAPARGVFRAHRFREVEPGLWELTAEEAARLPPLPSHIAVEEETGDGPPRAAEQAV